MSDDDLIRRGDVLKAVYDAIAYSNGLPLTSVHTRIRALPAVQPRVKPLVWLQRPNRLGELSADAEFGAYSVSDPTGRGRWRWQWHPGIMDALVGQSSQELDHAFPTRGDAIAAAEGHRKALILSALDNNTGKEVMPDEARTTRAAHDIGPGDQAVAGAAQKGDSYE
jgi:hypothetical protein